MSTDFKLKTEHFEGPLDLLLSLIEKRKLLINDFSLAAITDDYIQYLNDQADISIKRNSHFILVASTLLLIKSKSLLPTLELSYEEEKDIKDLEKRLQIYKKIKEVEPLVQERFGKNMSFYGGTYVDNLDIKFFIPSKQLDLGNLIASIKNVIKSFPKFEIKPKVIVKTVISLDEMINRLTTRIQTNLNMSFKEFSNFDKGERVNVIISFLAMLELVKNGIIEVNQKGKDDIEIQTKTFDTPKYI